MGYLPSFLLARNKSVTTVNCFFEVLVNQKIGHIRNN